MSGGFALLGLNNASNAGADTANSDGTLVRASGTAHTKGNWTQLVASSANDAVAVIVQITGRGGNVNAGLAVDIGVGTQATEQVLLPNLMSYRNDLRAQNNSASYFIPINIPAGTRISARCQSTATVDGSSVSGNTCGVRVILFDGDFTQSSGGGGVDAIGFASNSTAGTAVTPGAVNTKGSYAQLVASTAADYAGFIMAIDDGQLTTDHPVGQLWDIAVGAAACLLSHQNSGWHPSFGALSIQLRYLLVEFNYIRRQAMTYGRSNK